MRNRSTLVVLFALFLNLAACASNPATVTKIVPVPSELTEQVPAPQLQGDTNSALADWIDAWREALKEANRRLKAIEGIKP